MLHAKYYNFFFKYRLCTEFKRTSFENEPLHKELYRKLNCARYNTLIAVLACTQNDLRYYNAILFKEHPVKVIYLIFYNC